MNQLHIGEGKKYRFDAETRREMFGHEDAAQEKLDRLNTFFLKKNDFETVSSNLPLCIILGVKGIGKSATLRYSHNIDIQKATPSIWIRPDDIVAIYDNLNAEQDIVRLITLWKKGISRVVCASLCKKWMFAVGNDAETILQWAEDAGYREKDFLSRFARITCELIDKNPKVLRDELPDVGEHHVLQRIISDKKLRIYIDDLDRGWEASKQDRNKMSALLYALCDLTSDIEGLQIRISLRADVYNVIRTTKEFTDKLESAEVWCKWTNHEILVSLVKRIHAYLGTGADRFNFNAMSQRDIAQYLTPVFEPSFTNTTIWREKPTYRVLMSLVRRRPRDLIKLCNISAEKAHERNQSVILGQDICDVLDDYSTERTIDIVNEFSSEQPHIEALINSMGPSKREKREKLSKSKFIFTTDELIVKIKDILSSINLSQFNNGLSTKPIDIAHFLYKIGLIEGRKNYTHGIIDRINYDKNRNLLRSPYGDRGYSWEIHPAYRSYLHTKMHNMDDWKNTLELDADID